MSGSMKLENGVPGFSALSARVRRRSSPPPGRSRFCSASGEGVAGVAAGGGTASRSAGLISVLNSSRISPSAVKIRLSVTFSSFGACFSFGKSSSAPLATECRVKSRVWNVSTQLCGEETVDPFLRVGRGFGSIAFLVVRIHERVPRVCIDLDVRTLAGGFQCLLECGDGGDRDAAILRTEVAEEGSLDLCDRRGIGDEPAVVDDGRGQARFLGR